MSFRDRLQQAMQRSPVCVGLDTDLRLIPEFLHSAPNPILEFNCRIVDATIDLVGAYKPNFAFYEGHGVVGMEALRETVAYIRAKNPDIITVADAKRGDIGNTAAMYAQSIFEDLEFDCVTVNPYMGWDSVSPFVKDPEYGAFILCLTSNSGSHDFQYKMIDGKPLYRHVAEKAQLWNTSGNIGLVVGATHPDDMKSVREAAGDMPFLVPGIGAQGGDLASVVKSNATGATLQALINSSRNIIYASNGKDFEDAARKATEYLRDQIEKLLQSGV